MTQNAINNSASSIDIDNINIDGNTISSTDANGNVIIAPNGTGTVSVTTAPIVPSGDRADSLGSATNSWDNVYCDGLTFDDGTNILATYIASGSITPTITFGGASVGVTYGTQTGTYTKIGNLVWFEVNIILTNKGSSTGNCSIGGLPFTSVPASEVPMRLASVTFTGGRTYAVGVIAGASTSINIIEIGSGVAFLNVQETGVINTSQFFTAGFYRAS